jgi:toxin ParE1/3/4
MTRIEWTRSAVSDVRNLRDYIARDSEAYAERFVQKIIEAAEKVGASPRVGRKLPEADQENIREIVFGIYRIVYRAEESRSLILMVIHGARDTAKITPKPWEVD